MSKVVPMDKNWFKKYEGAGGPSPRKRAAGLEQREALAVVNRHRVSKAPPAVGWSDPSEQLFTLEEVAHHFRVKSSTIRKWERAGELVAEPCGKSGRTLRFSRAAIDAYKTRQLLKRHA